LENVCAQRQIQTLINNY